MAATSMEPTTFGDKEFPMAGTTSIAQGEIACINSDGFVVPGSAVTGLVAIGIAKRSVDNSSGSDGDLVVPVMTSADKTGGRRVFPIVNNGTDACDDTSRGHDVFIAGPNKVRKTSNSGACSRAGKCWDFDRDGNVLVEFDVDPDAVDIADAEARLDAIEAAAPGMQAANATLSSGTVTINTGIVVAANSEVIPLVIGTITGSTNFATLGELKASRVNGAAGVGTVVIQAWTNGGVLDADAAGAIRVVILTPL